MNGQLALMAALAAISGRWLRDGGTAKPPELLHTNSSFQYVGSFMAKMPPRRLFGRDSTITSPEDWLTGLHATGATDLSLITDLPTRGQLPAHFASAFANSGTWALLATGACKPTAWFVGWELGDRDAPNSRIWSLTAASAPSDGLTAPTVTVAHARDTLAAALSNAQAFVKRHDELSSWQSWFAKARALLDDPAPQAPYHRDLLPSDAALDRRQLAAAVVQAWVFGGMGSWNDGAPAAPAAQPDYERVSADLYGSLLSALPAATNGA